MTVWQIASGSYGRDYAEEFLKFGLAFVGGDDKVAQMQKVKTGDRVILKRGMTEIVAVGEIVMRDDRVLGIDDKQWLRDFDGWDLRAWCNVDWHHLDDPIRTKGLTRAIIQEVHQDHLLRLVEDVISTVPVKIEYETGPRPTEQLTDTEILSFLVQNGLRPGAAEELATALGRIRLLTKYYYENVSWERISEHEARTFLVVPLLLALGWSEQQMKIELKVPGGGRSDIACFRKPYLGEETDEVVMVVETKGFNQGLTYAPEQAAGYAAQFEHCQRTLVTNGYCYKAYKRFPNGKFSTLPSAYLNLLDPRNAYPLDPENVAGALEVLRLLMPAIA